MEFYEDDVTALNLGNSGYDDVFTPLPAWTKMEQKRQVCRDLMNGVDAIREEGTLYLPQKAMEKDSVYETRLAAATLYNAFRRAVTGLVGRVFSKQLDVVDGPDKFQEWYENIDFMGNNIDMFAKDVFDTAMAEGISFILIDFPPAANIETMEDEKNAKIPRRPYWVHIKPYEVIGWRVVYDAGIPRLAHIRVRQVVEQPEGDYGVKWVERVRVYEPGICKEYYRDKDAENPDVMYREFEMGIKDDIPIVPIYTNRKGIMLAEPALYDLAILNIRWYQSNSTQDHILDYARFPILFGKKIFHETGQDVPFGPSNMIHSTDSDAELTYVEHQGHAIKAGAESLDKLEERMAALSHEPLLAKRSGNETATRVAIDSAAATSTLQAWAFQFKDALEQCLVFTAKWMNADEKKAGAILINTDYALTISQTDYDNLVKLRKDGELSRTTLWAELTRRGMLGPDFNGEEEMELLQMEGAVQDNGDGLLSRMIDKQVLPRELLFNELKRRGAIDPDLEWEDVMEMLQRESVGPDVTFGGMDTLNQMLGAGE
jgi:hypothetical protein